MNINNYKIRLRKIIVITLIFILTLPSFTFATSNTQGQIVNINYKESISLIEKNLIER